MKHVAKKYFWPVIIGTGFIAFFLYMTLSYYYKSINYKDQQIAEHIEQLKDIFIRINETCKIVKFDRDKNTVNFLNTIQFAGSNVGPMHLLYPERWEGPYLKEELTVQNKSYQIVRAKKGYFVVPGDGVKLYNGKVIGKDIIINRKTNVKKLIKDPEALLSPDNKPLAAKVPVSSGFDLMAPQDLYPSIDTTA
jgi:hypothetical protein